ncbi:hypothetical protein FEF65_10720 [Mariprofundus erugo]|uniref:Plasmid replication protein RepL domain-containing protein n=1 Tax=Mariprofundus erugo TaxID=2528639 RepID=A0A5R9GMU6_9PROT|nr:replication/maintenance protein RepL [Mariprofundus erugo]TLS66279.1 hypothetical protein FEF65_10720 [Mariprofundus erugo]
MKELDLDELINNDAAMDALKKAGYAVRTHRSYDANGNLIAQWIDRGDKNFKLVDDAAWLTFSQMSAKNKNAASVFFYLVHHMSRSNALVISRNCLAEALGISVASVARHIKYLQDNNYVEVLKSGNTNIYHINKTIVWNGKGKKYAKFDAQVIVSRTEQDKNPFEPQTNYTKHVSKKETALIS